MVQYINGVLRITCTSLRVYTVHEQVLIVNEMSLRVYTVHLQVLTGLVACMYIYLLFVSARVTGFANPVLIVLYENFKGYPTCPHPNLYFSQDSVSYAACMESESSW